MPASWTGPSLPREEPTIAAVVAPAERPLLDAAALGSFSVLHQDTVPEAVRTVRERAVDAVLLSAYHCSDQHPEPVDELVRNFPGIPTVALVTRHDARISQTLLRLGATGIREVIDVTAPAGWKRLRQVVAEPATRGAARILAPVLAALPNLPSDARFFLEVLVRLAPSTPAVRTLARRLQQQPSTLMSRFVRAELPSPKTYLAAVRLLYAAQYFEGGGRSVSDVAYRLDCSSPQSFGRTLRAMLGITPSEFRRRYTFPFALTHFLDHLIAPYEPNWSRFHPLQGPVKPGSADRARDL
jgi:AraC-like DNA-binding protein